MKYIPNVGSIAEEMLRSMGMNSIEDLLSQIPEALRYHKHLPNIPDPKSELELRRDYKEIASKNKIPPHRTFCGCGIYAHDIPAAVDSLASRGEFLTSYTPYQPEISQGTLISIYEFQSMISRLLAMEVTNASMYDGSTSFAEAVLMAKRLRPHGKKILISQGIYPEVVATALTTLAGFDIEFVNIPLEAETGQTCISHLKNAITPDTLAIAVQTPNYTGTIENLMKIRSSWVANSGATEEALFLVHTGDPIAFGMFEPPGTAGADIVTGEAQPLGCYPAYGGPAVGVFSTKQAYIRQMPGRLVGRTIDTDGRISYCLTLSTREQHIRREKATSNICTNQGWCALRVTIYLAMKGPRGLAEVADQCFNKAHYLADHLSQISGVRIPYGEGFFNEFVVEIDDLDRRFQNCLNAGIVPGVKMSRWSRASTDKNRMVVSVTELMSKADLDDYISALRS